MQILYQLGICFTRWSSAREGYTLEMDKQLSKFNLNRNSVQSFIILNLPIMANMSSMMDVWNAEYLFWCENVREDDAGVTRISFSRLRGRAGLSADQGLSIQPHQHARTYKLLDPGQYSQDLSPLYWHWISFSRLRGRAGLSADQGLSIPPHQHARTYKLLDPGQCSQDLSPLYWHWISF